jgi:hypothetical protein
VQNQDGLWSTHDESEESLAKLGFPDAGGSSDQNFAVTALGTAETFVKDAIQVVVARTHIDDAQGFDKVEATRAVPPCSFLKQRETGFSAVLKGGFRDDGSHAIVDVFGSLRPAVSSEVGIREGCVRHSFVSGPGKSPRVSFTVASLHTRCTKMAFRRGLQRKQSWTSSLEEDGHWTEVDEKRAIIRISAKVDREIISISGRS